MRTALVVWLVVLAGLAGCFGGSAPAGEGDGPGGGGHHASTWKSINETFTLRAEPPGVAIQELDFEDAPLVRLHFDLSGALANAGAFLYTPEGNEYAFSGTLSQPMVVLGAAIANIGREGWRLEVHARDNLVVPYDIRLTVEHVTETPKGPGAATPARPWPARGPEVVVAVVDSGINPYHEAFGAVDALGAPAAEDATTGRAPINVTLSRGFEWTESLAIDHAVWSLIERQQIYRFQGTRLLGVSVGEPQFAPIPVLDMADHGTAVAGSVLSSFPDATILAVQAPSVDWVSQVLALDWIRQQPWIDIVVMSMSNKGSVPVGAGVEHMAEATRAVVASGKLMFVSSGNEPGISWTSDPVNGPPWIIQIGAATNRSGDQAALSDTAPDFVSDYDVPVVRHDAVNGTTIKAGTSYSAPKAAGAFGRALLEVREALGHLGGATGEVLASGDGIEVSRMDLDDALQRAATYWGPDDYDAQTVVDDVQNNRGHYRGAPILPGAPWLQMGWGYLDGVAGDRAAQHLLATEPLPDKPPEAIAYMDARQDARVAIWGPGP